MTPIVFVFPNWFYGILSLTFLAGVWYVARQSKTFSEVCKEFPKMRRALDLMSEALFSNKMLSEKVYVSTASPLRLTDAGKFLLRDFCDTWHHVISENSELIGKKRVTSSCVYRANRIPLWY